MSAKAISQQQLPKELVEDVSRGGTPMAGSEPKLATRLFVLRSIGLKDDSR
jgi:hypothetical protein